MDEQWLSVYTTRPILSQKEQKFRKEFAHSAGAGFRVKVIFFSSSSPSSSPRHLLYGMIILFSREITFTAKGERIKRSFNGDTLHNQMIKLMAEKKYYYNLKNLSMY